MNNIFRDVSKIFDSRKTRCCSRTGIKGKVEEEEIVLKAQHAMTVIHCFIQPPPPPAGPGQRPGERPGATSPEIPKNAASYIAKSRPKNCNLSSLVNMNSEKNSPSSRAS